MRQDLGAWIQNGIGNSQTLPPRVYPERTKRCGGSGLACETKIGGVLLCFAGQLSRKSREWAAGMSLYKLIAFVSVS